VHITRKKGVLINGGGSYLKLWEGGIEYGTEAGWVVHARTHGFEGARSLGVPYGPSKFAYTSFVIKGKFPFSR
jgi:type VI secretion system secreted protein VgrG